MKPMRVYLWQAQDAQGRLQRGHLHSPGPQQARYQLSSQGLQGIRLKRTHASLLKPVRRQDITLILRQLATLLAAGLPLLQALHMMGQGLNHPRLQDLLHSLRNSLETGLPLSAAMALHPQHFSALAVQLVAAGEQSGLLDAMLERLATHMESTQALQATLRSALTYPVTVLLVAVAVVSLIMVKVVPSFKQVFASYGAELPLPTLWVIQVSELLQTHGWVLLLALLGAALVWPWAWQRYPTWRERVHSGLLRLPLVGPLLVQAGMARWSRTLATLCAAGVPLVQALNSAGGAAGYRVFVQASAHMASQVAQGQGLSQTMAGLQLFPPMVLQLCAVGEASGSLEAMLHKAADFEESGVKNRLGALMSVLEPALMVVMGSLIGGIVVAMYLPVFKMGQVI